MYRCFFTLLLFTGLLHGANWVMLQGTEKKTGHHPWGFFQVRVEHNYGEIFVKDGVNKTPFSYVKPKLQNQHEIQLARARAGIRGSCDDANKINYFVLTEIAQNGVNNPLDEYTPSYLTDASITLKYFPIYLRLGKFKYAGSEEGNMARFVSPFINFSTVSNQMMLERFVDNFSAKPSQGVGAYRDTGLQLFKALKVDDKSEVTLSYMLGNGSGIANKNINANHYTHYGYLSYEKVLGGGKGYHEESLKFYLWAQSGKRLLQKRFYDRKRYGLGATYFQNGLRVEAEYMRGEGMIVSGVSDRNSDADINDWVYNMKASSDNKADGYYLLSTYELFEPLEVIVRYDVYNRLTSSDKDYRKFQSTILGFSYKYKNYDRIDVNYAFNDIKAPRNSVADDFLASKVGGIFTIQVTMLFK